MNNINYQLLMEEILDKVKKLDKKPKLLLHACCGPCSSYVLECLSNYFDITILYYNPNIYPEEEFIRRKNELISFIEKAHLNIKVVECDYRKEDYYNVVKGHENDKERGERCFICYRLRMREACIYAKNNNFDYFTTTLSISPYKIASKINEIGEELEKEFNISYLYADFKKKNGYQRSLELSKEYNLYRQDYCGCIYSYLERKEYENKMCSSR